MSGKTPWYVEHSKKPKGAYGDTPFLPTVTSDGRGFKLLPSLPIAEPNPENRRGVMLNHHTDYGDAEFQRAIAEGLAILREAPERVVMVGGDLPDGSREYYHIGWNASERTYEIVREGRRNRAQHHGVRQVFDALDETFSADSFVCAILIYVKNSPFNVPEPAESEGGFIGA